MEWVSSVVTLLVCAISTGGVLLSQKYTARRERERAAEARVADRKHDLWELSRPAAERLAEVTQRAIEIASRPSWEAERGYALPFDEGFSDWWGDRFREVERDCALIPDPEIRKMLGTVREVITRAWAFPRYVSRSMEDTVRDAAEVGFEIASAWLRDEKPDDEANHTLNELAFELMTVDNELDAEWEARKELSTATEVGD